MTAALLYDVRPVDPWIYGAASVFFGIIAAAACLIPSLRAACIDPMRALRAE